jgi:hypothetical protein
MRQGSSRRAKMLLATAIASLGLAGASGAALAGTVASASGPTIPTFHVAKVLLGSSLTHTFTPPGSSTAVTDPLTKPDDITQLGNILFVGFQNGVGPQGEATTDGNVASTVVGFTPQGHVIGQWDVTGKIDGLTADPELHGIIATVNEDANSALNLVRPDAPSKVVTTFKYNKPLPHFGGTDAISVFGNQILISASAPGTTNGATLPKPYPAVYSVTLDPSTLVATVTSVFSDEASATVANVNSSSFGQTTTVGLTDPDSNTVVPFFAPRFGGSFELTSQGDLEQIYVNDPGSSHQQLAVLRLTQSVDDTAWPTVAPDFAAAHPGWTLPRIGRLFSTDSTNDAVDVVAGPFRFDQPMVVATPCGSNNAPPTCPGAGFGPNYLATLNPWTGQVNQVNVTGVTYTPQGGLLFVPSFSQ